MLKVKKPLFKTKKKKRVEAQLTSEEYTIAFKKAAGGGGRFIKYYSLYAEIMEGVSGGVVLSQIMSYASTQEKVCQPDSILMTKCGVTAHEIRLAKSKMKELPFLIITKEGVPQKTYYTLDWKKWMIFLVSHNSK